MVRRNAINVIFPYKRHGVWAFDDPSVGLVGEPFVMGIPEMLELLVKDVPEAEEGFALFFAANPFPQYQAQLVRFREEFGGAWYRQEGSLLEGWLCPALLLYFETAPERLYVAAAPRGALAQARNREPAENT